MPDSLKHVFHLLRRVLSFMTSAIRMYTEDKRNVVIYCSSGHISFVVF